MVCAMHMDFIWAVSVIKKFNWKISRFKKSEVKDEEQKEHIFGNSNRTICLLNCLKNAMVLYLPRNGLIMFAFQVFVLWMEAQVLL